MVLRGAPNAVVPYRLLRAAASLAGGCGPSNGHLVVHGGEYYMKIIGKTGAGVTASADGRRLPEVAATSAGSPTDGAVFYALAECNRGDSSMEHLVLTVIAEDQPGLVERIAQCVAGHGGNWLESRMARMAGQFAGILRVDVPADSQQALVAALNDLQYQGIRVLLAASGSPSPAGMRSIHLTLVGNDRAGIVRDITGLLAEHGVNVERLDTAVAPAPMTGDPLFHADALLAVPQDLTLERLQARLEELADDLMVELELQALS